jgi:hypothetical protein
MAPAIRTDRRSVRGLAAQKRDAALQRAIASPATFERTVESYQAAGGRVPPRLAEHCAELMAAGPVGYGLHALLTGDPQHRAAASAQLDPGRAEEAAPPPAGGQGPRISGAVSGPTRTDA